MISALNKQPDGTIELTISIPWKRVEESYQKALNKIAQGVTVKGFRKGKAPLKMVEEKTDKSTIYQEALKTLVPEAYLEAVREQKITPILNPQIKVVSLEEGKDWQIIATTCELPAIKLEGYESAIRKALAAEKIWVPGKDEEKATPEQENKKLEKIFKTLLGTIAVTLPTILIEEEVNRMLSRLIDQTSKLGLTIEQYLSSIGKTNEQLRQEYQKQAEETLKLELILSAIADEEKISIPDTAVDKMIEATPDEAMRKSLQTPTQRAYIRQLLRKKKMIDNLMKL